MSNSGVSVALADVNGDGKLDIYVCATITKIQRFVQTCVHQPGRDKTSPLFKEEAAAYGVADMATAQALHSSIMITMGISTLCFDKPSREGVPTTFRAKVDDGQH